MQALAGMLPSPLMHSDDMLDVVVVHMYYATGCVVPCGLYPPKRKINAM
jgi:hypothetical protein